MVQQQSRVAVLAAAGGRVSRIRDDMIDLSVREKGADTIKGHECGNGVVIEHRDGWQTQYCHMAQGSVLVKPDDEVQAGDPLGLIGLSGNTEFPHLHLTVRKDGKVIDPFAFEAPQGACHGGRSLWEPESRLKLAYRAGIVLNKGFSFKVVTMNEIESGEAEKAVPTKNGPALVAYVRAIGLTPGDVQRLTIIGPDGGTVADYTIDPLDRPKAQYLTIAGRRRTGSSWLAGIYHATFTIRRKGVLLVNELFDVRL